MLHQTLHINNLQSPIPKLATNKTIAMIPKLAIAVSFFITITFTSCNKWLEITPKDSIDDTELFKTGFGYRNSLNGIYINMASPSLYGRELSWGFCCALGQEYIQDSKQNNALYHDASKYIFNSLETEPVITKIWEDSYTTIANLNKLIENIEKADKKDFEFGEDEQNLILAEALGLRALLHFNLLQLFAPSPKMLSTGGLSLNTNNLNLYIPYKTDYNSNVSKKISVTDFLNKTIDDLDKAAPILQNFDTKYHPEAMFAYKMGTPGAAWNAVYRYKSSQYIDNLGEFFWYRGFRLNYMSLLAIKARVCMYAGKSYYPIAKAAAHEVFNTFYKDKKWLGFTPKSKITTSEDVRFTKMFHDVIFGVYRKKLCQEYLSDTWSTVSGTSSTRLPLGNIKELFATDNYGNYQDYRFLYTIGKTNEVDAQYYSLKYNESQESDVTEIESPLIPIIRFSEICHILAEISCEENNLEEGIKYLEIVRKARGANRSVKLNVTSPEDLMQEILLDIRKENLAERGSFFTYKRLNIKEIVSANGKYIIEMRPNYVLPIPKSEIN